MWIKGYKSGADDTKKIELQKHFIIERITL